MWSPIKTRLGPISFCRVGKKGIREAKSKLERGPVGVLPQALAKRDTKTESWKTRAGHRACFFGIHLAPTRARIPKPRLRANPIGMEGFRRKKAASAKA